jgi:hypothetical protein
VVQSQMLGVVASVVAVVNVVTVVVVVKGGVRSRGGRDEQMDMSDL